MASSNETVSMALFCDFENVALGVRDAKYDKFDIKLVLERLLLKGSIVVKKAYCDWERYKSFKGAMHEANFELIEIPHVRQSGKNSADIRLVVDALDLCYTKSHVNTFVIISGDSDFSPLVSKLRENAKQVIGVGVQQSTSDLLIANCDEFFFYDDLVRESQRAVAKRESARPQQSAQQAAKRAPDEDKSRNKEDLEKRRTKAVEIAVQTFDALASERGDSGKIWASVLKNAIKRRKPDFNETYYGFRAFGNLLEEAQARGLLEFGRDEKSGAYVYRSAGPNVVTEHVSEPLEAETDHRPNALLEAEAATTEPAGKHESRRRREAKRKAGRAQEAAPEATHEVDQEAEASQNAAHRIARQAARDMPQNTVQPTAQVDDRQPIDEAAVHARDAGENGGHAHSLPIDEPIARPVNETAESLDRTPEESAEAVSNGVAEETGAQPKRTKARATRKTAARKAKQSTAPTPEQDASDIAGSEADSETPASSKSAKKTARKTPARSRRVRKNPATSDVE